ncbi:flagellar basal body-associated protein FliL [Thermotoga sp. 38H-to]|uniref:flagellar basal body-associated FliL family protein n=1 Tax=Thermotoga sp. 38H-to TaxID=1755812 RepID=UPI0013EDA2B1|nr:flagellar basal body-associated protein FliL [Thermotoga sp. 38H-to]KAF2959843.1 flagellar basal body protein FliL [Thermotoga sp. 38H-to]
MAEEERREEEQPKRRMGASLIMSIVVPLVVSVAVYFLLPMFLGSNQGGQSENVPSTPVRIKAVLIQQGENQTFLLKGGRDVVVIDSLSFSVGSDACRAAVAERKDEIMDALMMIFLSKDKSELSTVPGLELLKRQIRDAVNTITGFVGDKEKYGVLDVYLYIKAFATTE